MNSAIETEFLSRIAKKYKLDIIKLTSLWEKKPDIIVISQKYSLSENDLNDIYIQVENEMKDYDEFNDDIVFESQLTFSESQHMSKDDEISLTKFGLVDIPLDNIYNMRKLKLLEGESKFFLRQLINSYRFLKYHEKLNITSLDFYKIYNNKPDLIKEYKIRIKREKNIKRYKKILYTNPEIIFEILDSKLEKKSKKIKKVSISGFEVELSKL